MEQLIQAFGIDVKLIVVQIINFTILVAVLSYFLYKPVLKLLAEREEKVRQGIKDAETAARALSEAEGEKQTVLATAHKEAEAIAKRAKTFADEKTAAITAAADEKASNIISQAEEKAINLQTQARKDSEAEIAKLAVLTAEKILADKQA